MQSKIANNIMKKKILSIMLCFCMMLSLLPMTAQAASTHSLTVTGGVEGVDYQWGGNIYTILGELYRAENVLVILTSKELVITGNTKDVPGFKDVISINNGITANLTLNGVNLVSSSSSAGITIAPGGALNLTLHGTNTFTQNADYRNCPAIRVPAGASLTITAKSTGSLTSSTNNGSAVIGGYNKENCGTVTINGGTFDLSATGGTNVDYIGGPAIGPGAYASNGTIIINGGFIKAYSQWGAAIGSGYNAPMGQVGQQNETIVINGGTVIATTEQLTTDGIGGFGGKAITGGVTISGGSVNTLVRNTRPKNAGGENLYKATLTLHGAAAGNSVSSLTATTSSGASYNYNFKDIVTDSSGTIYIWLPEGAKVTKITAGGTNYTGASVVTSNDSETEIFYPENSPEKKFTLTAEINDGRIFALSDVKCNLTITDGSGASETFQNLPFSKDKNNPSRAVLNGYEFYTVKTDITKIRIALCSGDISWEKDVPSDSNVWMVNIGARIYKTMLLFRNEAVTTDIAVSNVTFKQGGTQLDAAEGEYYVPDHISKQSEGYGTMEAYLPENSGSTEISVTAAALNSGNAITKTGQSITTDGLTSILMLNKTNSEAVAFSETLNVSYGNITFEDVNGDLKITYSDASGQKSVTTFYEAEYRITGSSIGNYSTKSYGIKVLSTGVTTLQLVLDNVSIEKVASDGNGDSDINSPPFNIEGNSKVSILLVGKNKISSGVSNALKYSRAAICVKEKATLVIGGDGSLEASTGSMNRASVIGGSGWTSVSDYYVDHCGTIRIEGGDITLNGMKAGISGGYVGSGPTGAVSKYGSFTMTGGSLKINCSDNAIGVKDISITGGTIYVGDKTIYGDNSLSVAGGTIIAGNFNAGSNIKVTGGTMFNPSGEQTGMNKTATNGAVSVYPVTADVSRIYGSNAAVSEVVITGVNYYGFTDVKTDDNGVLHLYLPENSNTNATFKGIAYQGAVSTGKDNILTIPCNHEQYTEDGYCTVCGLLQAAKWNATSGFYEISNAGQLEWFSKLVKGTLSGTDQNAAANGKLLKDVTAGSGFMAIGSETSPYTGTFDGGGHTVTLSIDKGSSSYQGLFGAVGGGVIVKNVGTAGTVKGGAFTAGIIGGSSKSGTVTIQNCWNEATVTGTAQNAAGIFGCNASGATITIENCYNIGAVSGLNESAGISGWLGNGATVKNCYNYGTVGGAENGKTFARYGTATFTNCYQLDTIGTQADITAKTLDMFKSGEVAYLLNGSKSEGTLTLGQTIGKDNYPVFYNGNNTVYKLADGTYANSLVKLTVDSPFNITSSSAEIAVSGDAGATVYYAASDTALTDGSKVEELATKAGQTLLLQADPATISLTGLAENKTYTYYIVAKVGSNYSNVAAVTFTTYLSVPSAAEVSVDYTNELLKANSGLGYTLEYALTSDAATWMEVTTDGVSLTSVLNNHSGADAITLYVHKKAGSKTSEAGTVTIPARQTCSVTGLNIDYAKETVTIPNSVVYQFAKSSPSAWTSATAGTDGEVSLNSYISAAGTADESLYKVWFRNPATNSAFVSKAVSVTIPMRPTTPALPTATSDNIKESSITLTSVPGMEYSKDNATWQDSTEFTGLASYTDQIFYQRIKATGSSFASAASSATIKTAKQSIASATVTLNSSNFIYNGSSQIPVVTVMMGEAVLDASQYEVSYFNSNGCENNTVNVGTITVTVTAKDDSNYTGTAMSQPTYAIDLAVPTITWSEADKTQSLTYTGKAANIAAPTVTLVNNETFNGTITYSYKALNSETYTDGLPTNAGTYLVKAHLAAKGNYTAADSTNDMTLTINKATAMLTITGIGTGNGKTYDGTPIANPTATQISSSLTKPAVTYTYYADNDGVMGDALSGAPTNAGVYWVKGVIGEMDNTTEASNIFGFMIEKAPLTIINGTVESRKWDGNTTAPVTKITFEGLKNNETLAFDTDYIVNSAAYADASVGTDKSVTAGTIELKNTAKSNNYTIADGSLSGKGLIGEITKADGPAAPNFSAWDDAANTFTFESANGTVYKYRINDGDWGEVTANSTTTTINVGNVSIPAGKLEVCIKETDTHKIGAFLTNTAEQVFTAELEGSMSLSKTTGVTYGDTLTATVSGQQDNAQLHYQWKIGDTNAGTDSSTYIVQGLAVGKTVTVIVTADSYEGSLTPATVTNEVAKKAVTAVLDGTITKEYDTTDTANIKLKINDTDKVNTSDEITITAPYAAYDSASVGNDKTIKPGVLTVNGAAADWYEVSAPANVTGIITQKTVNVTISCTDKIYDGSTDATVTYVVNGIFGSDDVTASGTAVYDSADAGNRTVTATGVTLGGAAKDEYKLPDNMTTCTATIGLAMPKVVWGESSKTQSVKYGNAVEITAPTVTLVNNETFDGTFTYSYKESGSTGAYISGLPTNAGTYLVKAHLAANSNYAAADSTNELTLTIEEPPEKTDAEKVAADKAVLEIGFAQGDSVDAVTQNLSLTVTGAVYGSKITWLSGNPAVISNSGVVIRPSYASGDADVTVTASVYSNGVSDTKVFSLKVLKLAQATHAVTFKDWDGKVLKTQTVNEGSGATAPGNPSREGYTFIGWDKDFSSVSSDLTVVAQYNVVNPAATDAEKVATDMAVLTIGFAQGNSADAVMQNLSLTVTGAVYGSQITWISSNPAVISVSGVVIRPSYASGDADVTVTASVYSNGVSDIKVFSVKVLKLAQPTYTVTFKDWYGTVLKTETVNEGSGATAPSNPSRDGYTFTGWDTVFSNVTSNLTVTAQYKKNTSGGDGGSSSGGGSGTSTPDTAKTYQAAVSENGAAATDVPVNVNKDTGSAVIYVGSDQGGIVKGGGSVAITMPSIPDIADYAINIPVPYLSTADASGTFTFMSDAGNIIVPSNMLTGTDREKGQKAQISISQGDKSVLSDEVKAVIGDRPIIRLAVAIDGNKTAWNNPDAPVTVSIPYKPAQYELENPDSIVVWYIDGSGKAVSVPNGHYDTATGSVTFITTHFSDYAVSYNKVSFSDVSSEAWYGRAVSYIAARGITTGTGNGSYNPEASITRGEFLVMLMRAYGINPDTDLADNFSDASNMYYTGYLAAAKRLGISKGIGNNMFAPDMEITRQEMFTLLYNALKEINHLPKVKTGKRLENYNDAQQVASWAREALALFSEAGTINGDGDKLLPTETTTRAEMAQVLYNLMKK